MDVPSVALPPMQYPDLLGSYVRGQMIPGAQQLQQQDITKGQLGIDQLRIALGNQQMYQDIARQSLQGQGYLGGPQPGSQSMGAQSASGPTGGIQSGPQASVSGPGNIGGFTPSTLGALALLRGDDPLKTAQGVQEYQKTQAQLQAQGPLNMMDSIFNSDQPAKTVMNNPSLISQWPKIAPQLGLDPVRDFNDANVRRAIAFAANNLRGQVGMPSKDYPVALQNVNLGQGEVGQIDPVTGKKAGDLIERQTPGYTLVDKWDPNTNQTTKVPVQTSGYGMQGARPGNPTAAGVPGYNIGYKAPTDPELKAAMFGGEMRAGMQKLNDLENRGVGLSPTKRAAFINAATSEDSGWFSQIFGQESLAHGITKEEQTYMAALMPLLQAAGHDQSGARLTTAQIRQNLESLIPLNTKNAEALSQVQANRQGFYQGLLTQAGSATQLPQYRNTLGADLKSAQGQSAPRGMPSLEDIRAELARRKGR